MSLNAELQRLSTLKDLAEVAGRTYKAESAVFKEHQTKCLDLMEAQECLSFRTKDGTLFTRCEDRIKGQIEDRRLYIRWALEQDEAVQEFLEELLVAAAEGGRGPDGQSQLVGWFYDCVMNTELVTYKEKQDKANAQARAHVDDEAPLPPGLTFRPDPFVMMRKS